MWGKNKKIGELVKEIQQQQQQQCKQEIELEDFSFIQQCYVTREDNIFQLRIYLMQLIENGTLNGRSSITNQIGSAQQGSINYLTEVRQVIQAMQNFERYRISQEDLIIAKYSIQSVQKNMNDASKLRKQSFALRKERESKINGRYESNGSNVMLGDGGNLRQPRNASVKALAFKIFSKMHKLNVVYTGKIQAFFPKLYEVISQEQLMINNEMKEGATVLISSSSLCLGKIFGLMAKVGRQRLARELMKLSNCATVYSSISGERSKNNKNERFYIDKILQGYEQFVYILGLQKKYFLRPRRVQLKQGGMQSGITCINNEDIMFVEKKKGDSVNATNIVTQPREYESIIEVILSNYDKQTKEWMHSNKQINLKIKIYTNLSSKFTPLTKEHSLFKYISQRSLAQSNNSIFKFNNSTNPNVLQNASYCEITIRNAHIPNKSSESQIPSNLSTNASTLLKNSFSPPHKPPAISSSLNSSHSLRNIQRLPISTDITQRNLLIVKQLVTIQNKQISLQNPQIIVPNKQMSSSKQPSSSLQNPQVATQNIQFSTQHPQHKSQSTAIENKQVQQSEEVIQQYLDRFYNCNEKKNTHQSGSGTNTSSIPTVGTSAQSFPGHQLLSYPQNRMNFQSNLNEQPQSNGNVVSSSSSQLGDISVQRNQINLNFKKSKQFSNIEEIQQMQKLLTASYSKGQIRHWQQQFTQQPVSQNQRMISSETKHSVASNMPIISNAHNYASVPIILGQLANSLSTKSSHRQYSESSEEQQMPTLAFVGLNASTMKLNNRSSRLNPAPLQQAQLPQNNSLSDQKEEEEDMDLDVDVEDTNQILRDVKQINMTGMLLQNGRGSQSNQKQYASSDSSMKQTNVSTTSTVCSGNLYKQRQREENFAKTTHSSNENYISDQSNSQNQRNIAINLVDKRGISSAHSSLNHHHHHQRLLIKKAAISIIEQDVQKQINNKTDEDKQNRIMKTEQNEYDVYSKTYNQIKSFVISPPRKVILSIDHERDKIHQQSVQSCLKSPKPNISPDTRTLSTEPVCISSKQQFSDLFRSHQLHSPSESQQSHTNTQQQPSLH